MRTLTAGERDLIRLGGVAWTYVEVTNYDGAWIRLTAVPYGSLALDFYDGGGIDDDIDRNTLSFSGQFAREIGTASLVPFRSDSPINVDALSNYQPALDLHRWWRQFIGVVLPGFAPADADYRELAGGRVRRIAIGEVITVEGRGREADLIDAWVPPGRTYAAGEMEDVIQQKLDDQFGTDVVVLTVADDPAFFLNAEDQAEGHFLPMLADLAALAVSKVRYRYGADDVDRFTIFRPSTSLASPVWEIGPNEYTKIEMALDEDDIRTMVWLTYLDASFGEQTVYSPAAEPTTVTAVAGAATFSASPGATIADNATIVVDGVAYTVSAYDDVAGTATLSGAPTFTAKAWYTSAAISRYGLRVLPIDLRGNPNVVTQAAAGTLADTIRADTETPPFTHMIEGHNLWFVQLHDVVTLKANGVHYIEDQVGMVTSIRHRFDGGMLITALGISGTPKGRYRNWLTLGSGAPRVPFTPEITNYSADYWERYTLGVLSSGGVADFGTVNAYVRSLVIDVGTDPTFALIDFSDPKAVTPSSNFTHEWEGASRAQIYYFRATPWSGPLDGGGNPTGVAGPPAYAQTYMDALRPTQPAFDALVDDVSDLQDYVDAKVAGLSWKQAVRAATTVAGTLASSFENGDTIDGVTLATGDRILVKNQAAPAENGIYTVNASGAPTRATDADAGAELVNATCYVSEGTTNADTQWTCTTNAPITLGSTSLTFAQLSTGGGSSPAATTVAIVTASLADGATETGTVTIAKSALMQKVVASAACWMRLYETSAARTSDASRLITVSPKAGLGILSNVAPGLDSAGLTVPITPAHELHNGDGPRTTTIYYSVTNRSGSTGAITLTLTYLPVET